MFHVPARTQGLDLHYLSKQYARDGENDSPYHVYFIGTTYFILPGCPRGHPAAGDGETCLQGQECLLQRPVRALQRSNQPYEGSGIQMFECVIVIRDYFDGNFLLEKKQIEFFF